MKTFLACLSFTFLFSASVFADELTDAKQHIQARQTEVASLKEKGALGENNLGFLEVRDTGTASAGGVASAENHDRSVLYAVVAKRTNATPESVGKARAKELAQSSRRGVWVQDEGGSWSRK